MKKVLIIFPDPHLSYSPSTLNLYDALDGSFEVTILAFEPDKQFSRHKITGKRVEYLSVAEAPLGVPLHKRLFREIHKTLFSGEYLANLLLNEKARAIIERIRGFEGEIIAVDFFALWCAQKAGKRAHLFSLEIHEADAYRNECDLSGIESVIIQSKDRYSFLFGDIQPRVFFVQNAPNFIDTDLPVESRKKKDLVFCGSAIPWFGIYNCIDFIVDYPEYSLTLKGAIPANTRELILGSFGRMVEEKRLIMNDEYMEPEELNDFLKYYYIGFVFYDYFRFEFINRFNYKTAPSGKLFQYYNAGVPVIANNLRGLDSVREFGAGVQIDTMSPGAIRKAINQIDLDYGSYAKGAKAASLHFDFGRSVRPFVDFLISRSSAS